MHLGAAVAAALPKDAKASNLGSYVKFSGGLEIDPDTEKRIIFNGSALESAFSKYEVVGGLVTHEPQSSSQSLIILGGTYQNKDKYSGATVHIVNEKLDSGKIILQKKVKILKSDSGKSLEKKVLKIEHKIYPIAIFRLLASD